MRVFLVTWCLAQALAVGSALADEPSSKAALAKQLSNPVAPLTVLPFQFNYDRGYGPDKGDQLQLNIQPIVPFKLNEDWYLITRTIVPIEQQTDIAGPSGSQFGIGDTLMSLFLSPVNPGVNGLIWGAGPVFLFPTATDDLLGSEKWGAGPTGVVAFENGPWTTGLLANHVWSFAGADDRTRISTTMTQPFVSYNTKSAWTFSLTSEAEYDWVADDWIVPIDFTVGKLVMAGKQPVSLSLGARYWATAPDNGPEGWGLRAVVSFVFPK
ncbi:hypothetical protein [Martelella endophytica]|uniref:Transporter n=1 Tax=Martelella endophytica TaxID=1486262 RepID=A0A0D5LQ94_MAREN|nr:hypothetical protein [Martelella endophytica]AJY46369.1 hypothetical protein TM49_12910 [Martelella endophytica]